MRLPAPERLKELCQALALLDEILEPEWDMRYFSFDAAWGPRQQMASMRDGEGSYWFIWFSPAGTVIRGFDRERRDRPRSLWKGLPRALAAARDEPAFDEASFAMWSANGWSSQPGKGSARLLWILDDQPKTYVKFARQYFERKLAPSDVAAVYARRLDADLIQRLNPDARPAPIVAAARKLGFAVGAAPKARVGAAPKARVPAALTKLVSEIVYPQLLAKRLRTFAMVDAIMAPARRNILVERRGNRYGATLAWGGAELRIWISGSSAVLYGGADASGEVSMPPALARRWRATAAHPGRSSFLCWHQGGRWVLGRGDARVLPLLQCLHPRYGAWADRFYRRKLAPETMDILWWQREPLTRAAVAALNPKARWSAVAREARALGLKVDQFPGS